MRGKPKGLPKTGGRKKGSSNRLTADLRSMIEQALRNAGGVKYLSEQAKANPKAFLALLGRLMPLQVAGTGSHGEIVISFTSSDEGLL